MSTYLVALVVSDYGRIQEVTKTGVTLSIYAPPHMTSQAEFALKAAVKLFDYFQSFFGFSYPLPKLDLISMPDFAAGTIIPPNLDNNVDPKKRIIFVCYK